jgi:hypothetical protein
MGPYEINDFLIKSARDVPTGEHFVIIVYSEVNIFHEGDERSRTHPGHGYPAYTETIKTCKHYCFENKATWEKVIEHLLLKDKVPADNISAFKANGKVSFEVKTSISIY